MGHYYDSCNCNDCVNERNLQEKVFNKYKGIYFGRCDMCGHDKYYLAFFVRLHKAVSNRLSSEKPTKDIYIDKSEPNIKLSGEWIDTGIIDYEEDASRSRRVLFYVRRELGRALGALNRADRSRMRINLGRLQSCGRCGFSSGIVKDLVKFTISVVNNTLRMIKTVLMKERGHNEYEVPLEKMEKILWRAELFYKEDNLELSIAWYDTEKIDHVRMASFLRDNLAFISNYLSLLVELERKEVRIVE